MTSHDDASSALRPPSSTRCGVVALLGATNSGKSTFLNQAVGQKVSIVTHKVQTTRCIIRGIVIRDETQLVFMDTPGVFRPGTKIEQAMLRAAWETIEQAGQIVMLLDARKGICEKTVSLLETLKRHGRQAIGVLNKTDITAKGALLECAAALDATGVISDIFMISALQNDGVEDVLAFLAGSAEPGEWIYPADQVADIPMRLMAAEFTREQLLLQLHQEIPYGLMVETEYFGPPEQAEGTLIRQIVYVASESHKAMVIGKGGGNLRRVSMAAREALSGVMDGPIHLRLYVKVDPDWMRRPERLRAAGLI